MTVPFDELKQRALDSLRGNWGNVIGTYMIAFIIQGALQWTYVGNLIVGGPLALGMAIFNLSLTRSQIVNTNLLFDGFKKFGNALGTYLLMVLYILLWTLLLIIPGIIAALSYSMVFYILADEPELSPGDALRKSKAMMDGYKMDFFLLNLSFIGWALLCILTLFIGFLWLYPYIQITQVKFYEEVRKAYDGENDSIHEIGRMDDLPNEQFSY